MSRYLEEQLLLEKTRAELLNKSRNADIVKSYGTTRYERRSHQHLYNTVQNFNRIDMNALFRANLLSFIIPVKGETADYEVEVLFEGICDDIRDEIRLNKNILEFKCVYKALVKVINRSDILVSCTCPDWTYRQAYQATHGRYNGGRPQIVPAKITNPNDTKGAGCKHVMKVLGDLDWCLKLATCINNYIEYMKRHYLDKFKNVMFPVLWDISWDEANELGLFDNPDYELANTMDNDDTSEIDQANSEAEEPVEDEEEDDELEDEEEDNDS